MEITSIVEPSGNCTANALGVSPNIHLTMEPYKYLIFVNACQLNTPQKQLAKQTETIYFAIVTQFFKNRK